MLTEANKYLFTIKTTITNVGHGNGNKQSPKSYMDYNTAQIKL